MICGGVAVFLGGVSARQPEDSLSLSIAAQSFYFPDKHVELCLIVGESVVHSSQQRAEVQGDLRKVLRHSAILQTKPRTAYRYSIRAT